MAGRWSSRLSELRAELTVLRAAHRALSERVIEMERRASKLPSRSRGGAALEPDSPGERFRSMALPAAEAFADCVRQLFGTEISLAGDDPAGHCSELEDTAAYACPLLDGSGVEVGIVAASLAAAARLGGGLVGMPRSAIDELVRCRSLDEEALLSFAELCSSLTGPVNGAGDGSHVRPGELAPFARDRFTWLGAATRVCSLSYSDGERLWIVARSAEA